MVAKKEKTYRNSKLRQKILSLLVNAKTHLTADWIYNRLKKRFRGLTLTTVYRNLRTLKEQGQIWELDFGTGLSHFDAIIHTHYHFICNRCQKIYDLKIPVMKELDDKVMQLSGFRIISHRLLFFGLCDVCKLKRNNNKETKKP